MVGRVDDQTEAQAKADTACEQYFKEGDDGYIFSSIEPGKTGYVLCLTKKAPDQAAAEARHRRRREQTPPPSAYPESPAANRR